MRAVRLHSFGEPLRVDDVPEPEPAAGEVLFEVGFAGVNPLDLWLTDGTVAGGRQTLPIVPGSEAAGTVDGVRAIVRGAGLGVLRDGMYRERAAVPREAVIEIPDPVASEQAAGLGVAGETAWTLVHDIAAVTPQDRVLVLGASGGVGSLVIQLARAVGATVWGQTSDAGKADFVREQGAQEVVVADAAGLTAATARFEPTVVVDPLAGDYTGAAIAAMAPFGRLALFGASAGATARDFDLRVMYRKALQVRTYSGTIEPVEKIAAGVRSALQAAARGQLHVAIDEVLPLERAQEAHERIRRREVRGKLLLRP